MLPRPKAALLVLLLLVTTQLGAVAGAAAPRHGAGPSKDRATFGIGPASFGRVDPRSFFSYQTGPGGSYRDQAAVLNFGRTPLHLSLYVADLGNAPDGSVAAGLPTDTPHDVGAWLSLPARYRTVDVPASSSAGPGKVVVPLQLKVPADASPGDHGGAVIAVLSTLGKDPKGQNIRLDQRVASRVYVRVRGAVHAQLAVALLSATYHQPTLPWGHGHVTVTYVVRNTGNVRLSTQQRVTAHTWFSPGTTAHPDDIALLFPGAQQRVTVDVRNVLPTLVGHAHVRLTPHLFTDQPAQQLRLATATTRFWAVPWLLLVLALLIAGTVVVYRRRRRRPRATPRHAAHGRRRGPRPTPSSGQATSDVLSASSSHSNQEISS